MAPDKFRSSRSVMTLLLILGLAGSVSAAGKGKPPPPPPAPADPAIAFWIGSPSTGTWGDMMVMDADGSNQTVVVPGGWTRPVQPNWSPDGRSLVYNHLFNGSCSGLHVVSRDQNGNWGLPQPLLYGNQCIFGYSPAWSPAPDASGTHQVAFDGSDGSISLVKFKLDSNGFVYDLEGPTVLYDSAVTTISYNQPTWSPGGSKLAFIEYDDRPGQFIFDVIWIDVNDPSLTPTRLVNASGPLNGYWLNELSWAKHADLLAVSGNSPYAPYKDLWCINVDNPTETINLTAGFDQQNNANDDDPSWSPSGTQIVFSRAGVAMALNFAATSGCPSSASLSPIATAKGKKSMWGFDWRR